MTSPSPFEGPPFDPDDAPYDGDERQIICWLLDYHRGVMLRKLDGITDVQPRESIAKSDLTLLGLARHMGFVEQFWFGHIFLGAVGAGERWHYDDPDDPDVDFHPREEDTLANAVTVLHGEIRRARSIAATAPLDAVAKEQREGRPVNLRWILVHLIEEYARHCGHADLIRQAIDGTVGD
jgi:hypothetical protein